MLFMTDNITMADVCVCVCLCVCVCVCKIVTGMTGNLESPTLIKKRLVLFVVIDAQGHDPSICAALMKVSCVTDDITGNKSEHVTASL